MMLFVQYPSCSTCKKAKAFLDAHGAAYTARHIAEDAPTRNELALWQQRSGLPLKKFFNTSGQVYRQLELSKKLPAMTDAEQLDLLASNGMLVKRPILVTDTAVLVGFRPEDWENAV
jgi:arsenate reductase